MVCNIAFYYRTHRHICQWVGTPRAGESDSRTHSVFEPGSDESWAASAGGSSLSEFFK